MPSAVVESVLVPADAAPASIDVAQDESVTEKAVIVPTGTSADSGAVLEVQDEQKEQQKEQKDENEQIEVEANQLASEVVDAKEVAGLPHNLEPHQTETTAVPSKEIEIESAHSTEPLLAAVITESPAGAITGSLHVRVDNFQRPLTDKILFDWLANALGHEVKKEQLWMNKIKTHCYIDFETIELARACIAAVTGRKVDSKHTMQLSADFTEVGAAAAESSVEGKLKPNEWKIRKGKSDDTANQSAKALSTASNMTVAAGLPLRSLDTVNRALQGGTVNYNINRGIAPSPATMESIRGNAQVGFSTRRNSNSAESIEQPPLKRQNTNSSSSADNSNMPYQQDMKKTTHADQSMGDIVELDSLFRKTKAVPPLYWLPVSDDILQQRKLLSSK